MLSAHSEEEVCLWIPPNTFLGRNLIKHQDSVKDVQVDVTMNHVKHTVVCGVMHLRLSVLLVLLGSCAKGQYGEQLNAFAGMKHWVYHSHDD